MRRPFGVAMMLETRLSAAGLVRVTSFCGLEGGDDAGHGGRGDLLHVGELAEGARGAEGHAGERGELGGADAGCVVLAADASHEVEGGGVEADGELVDVSGESSSGT